MIRFGPSGNSESFYEQGNKSSVQMPGWLNRMGLNAYEYQCSRGVNIDEAVAGRIGEQAAINDVFLSVHAPYYINLASPEEEKRNNSINYIIDTMKAAKWMGAKRIVVHTGSCGKVDRKWAFNTASAALMEAIRQCDRLGLGDIAICPEVLGKMNQLGNLDEILEMCRLDERLIPTIDFAHLHARGMGCLNTSDDFEGVLNKIEAALGYQRLKHIHIHFSRVEFTAGGEKRHCCYDDVRFGPDFEFLAELLYIKRMEPVIICESRGSMAEDALKLKNIYEKHAARGGIGCEKGFDH
ncbi:deoxyribonuclease-4 [Anaerobacterium chartisolvens]|uniref:Deoxyribonuclease-4 n=1 Tax=Anaerobacterium chartisolvens TaxID=1297424 RepID=A0A369AIW7_9FIRM|nr:TIM barrel protein [Anaerobacterium chartisolvens]RCX09300.1 deoxyribonuclease-4 [Anaerobacterium chartisolvens]